MRSILITVILVATAWGCEQTTATDTPATTVPAAPALAVAEGNRIAISVEDMGYVPSTIKAKKGEELTLVFTRKSESTCGEFVVFPEHEIQKQLPLNKPVEVKVTPTSDEPLAFMCGMAMMKGSIVVQ